MQYKLTKIALAVVAFNTTIYFDKAESVDYLDEQSGFANVSEGLDSGWHWGINSANANSEDYGNGTTYFDGIFQEFDFDFGGGYDGGGGNGGGGDNEGGGGGGDGGGNEDNSVEQAQKYTQCLQSANASFSTCLGNTTAIDIAYQTCNALAGAKAGQISGPHWSSKVAAVIAAAAGGYACDLTKNDSLGKLPTYCSNEKSANQAECNSKYS